MRCVFHHLIKEIGKGIKKPKHTEACWKSCICSKPTPHLIEILTKSLSFTLHRLSRGSHFRAARRARRAHIRATDSGSPRRNRKALVWTTAVMNRQWEISSGASGVGRLQIFSMIWNWNKDSSLQSSPWGLALTGCHLRNFGHGFLVNSSGLRSSLSLAMLWWLFTQSFTQDPKQCCTPIPNFNYLPENHNPAAFELEEPLCAAGASLTATLAGGAKWVWYPTKGSR